jgi:hypothetical protein
MNFAFLLGGVGGHVWGVLIPVSEVVTSAGVKELFLCGRESIALRFM